MFKKKKNDQPESIESLADKVTGGKLSRRGFIAALSAMGATTAADATILTVAAEKSKISASTGTNRPLTQNEQKTVTDYQKHLSFRQNAPTPQPSHTPVSPTGNAEVERHIQMVLNDYHPDAILEDPLSGKQIIGHEAIAAHKRTEAFGLRNINIEPTNTFVNGEQIISEWVATGAHVGTFLGFPATNRVFNIKGVTVVTRRDGKIVKESLFYNLDDVRQQLGITF